MALLLSELAVLAVTVATGLGMYVLRGAPDMGGADPSDVMDVVLVLFLPLLLVFYLVQGTVAALAGTLAQQDASGTRVTVRGLVRATAPRIPGTAGAYLLTASLFPVLLTPLAPLVAWPWVLYSLAPSIMAHDRVGMLQALGRARELIRGMWWPVFVPLALAALIVFGVDVAVGFLSLDSVVQDFGEGQRPSDADGFGTTTPDIDVADLSGLLGLIIGVTTAFIGVLMLQVAFIHIVGDRLCEALRARTAGLAHPLEHGAVPPPRWP
ncbi:hypothetical protein ACFRJ1_14295 [Streptomyces sp. NPDC056773]|uniref:hypothetical protein n=1 Tax=unclassified Streptomyces TaxID=2593676 RepID=UPI00367749EE